jgi:maleate isomerase
LPFRRDKEESTAMKQSADRSPARYGLIIPAVNRAAEPHAARYSPPGVSAHTTRLRMTGEYAMALDDLLPRVAEAAAMLADAGCDPVVFHCTANSMADGPAGEKRISDTVETATGGKATTTAAAVMAAIEALVVKRLVLVSPYRRATHEHEIEFLEQAGIEVVGEENLGLENADDFYAVTPAEWVDIVASLKNDRAEAYFVSCANIRATEAIEEMEARLDRPVLASNQVVIWRALRLAGIDGPIPGLGRLTRAG